MLISSRAGLMWTWSQTATQELRRARQARALVEAGDREAAAEEFRATVVVVAASAAAIEALWGSVKVDCGVTSPVVDGARKSYLFEGLKQAFRLDGDSRSWNEEFLWLFQLRDDLLHFNSLPEPGGQHPAIPDALIDGFMARHLVETAERAHAFMAKVLRVCALNPRPVATEWVRIWGPLVAHGCETSVSLPTHRARSG